MPGLFDALPADTSVEHFEPLLEGRGLLLERIISHGQATPPDTWLCSERDEWVVLLQGTASLRLEADPRRLELVPGDHVFLPAGARHRVEATASPSIWLALHLAPGSVTLRG